MPAGVRVALLAAVGLFVVAVLLPILATLKFALPAVDDAAGRERVVDLVKAGQLGPTGSAAFETVPLPQDLKNVSDGGQIVVDRTGGVLTVVFYRRRGVVDSWEGWVYRSDGRLSDDPLQGGGPTEITPLRAGWFSISTR